MIDASHPLANLLSFEANPDMASGDWIETIVSHLSITGNSYSQIQRAADGSAVALWPLSPRKTDPVRLPGGALAYRTHDGMTNGQSRIIQAAEMLHIRLNSWDGVLGLSPVMMAKRALGLAVAAEKFGSRLFANGGTPQLALTSVMPVKPETKVQMKQDWHALQTGGNQHNIAILDNDLKLEKISLSPEESQFLETRKYTRSDIAALFRVPSHMIGELQKLSNSNTEEMNISFVVDTLRPLISKIESEFSRKLLPRNPGQPSTVQIAFDVSERLRGDSAAQAAWATAGRNGGWLTGNDVRRAQGLNAAGPELDVYISPINYENSQRLLDAPAKVAPVVAPETEGQNV